MSVTIGGTEKVPSHAIKTTGNQQYFSFYASALTSVKQKLKSIESEAFADSRIKKENSYMLLYFGAQEISYVGERAFQINDERANKSMSSIIDIAYNK